MTMVANTSYYNNTVSRYLGSNAAYPGTADDVASGISDKPASARKSAGDAISSSESGTPPSISFMGRVVNTIVLDKSNLKTIGEPKLLAEMSASVIDTVRTHIEMQKLSLQEQYTERTFPDYSNDPRMKNYATITIGGKVIATIDNQGVVTTQSDAVGAIITKLLKAGLPGENMIPGGPASAQFRAEHIAELLGGRVVKASTAMTQRQFNAMPPFEGPKVTIDYDGMKNDPQYAEIERQSEVLAGRERELQDYLASQQGGPEKP